MAAAGPARAEEPFQDQGDGKQRAEESDSEALPIVFTGVTRIYADNHPDARDPSLVTSQERAVPPTPTPASLSSFQTATRTTRAAGDAL